VTAVVVVFLPKTSTIFFSIMLFPFLLNHPLFFPRGVAAIHHFFSSAPHLRPFLFLKNPPHMVLLFSSVISTTTVSLFFPLLIVFWMCRNVFRSKIIRTSFRGIKRPLPSRRRVRLLHRSFPPSLPRHRQGQQGFSTPFT